MSLSNERKCKIPHSGLIRRCINLSFFLNEITLCSKGSVYRKVTLRIGLLLRTPVAAVRYDLQTEEKREGVRNGIRNEQIEKIHCVRNKTY
jgi:hypothetical protein